MNLKRAKRIRKVLKGKNTDYRHAVYIDSPRPKEKPHQKMYSLTLKQWTQAGFKNVTQDVPIKVGTVRLGSCGKQLYRRAKVIAQTF